MADRETRWLEAVAAGQEKELAGWLSQELPPSLPGLLVAAMESHSDSIITLFLRVLPAWRKKYPTADLSEPWRRALQAVGGVSLPALKALQQAGCSVDQPLSRRGPGAAEWSEPPLIVAVQAKAVESVKFLLENHAVIEARGTRLDEDEDFEELAPLHLAVQNNHLVLAKMLLESGADPNRRVKWESGRREFYTVRIRSALEMVPSGADNIAAILVNHGARVQKDGRDSTLEHLAAYGLAKAIKAAGESEDGLKGPEKLQAFKGTIHEAVRARSETAIRALLDQGARIDDPDEQGMTPLHLAAKWGADGCVALLISCRANLASVDLKGNTPLHTAVMVERLSLLSFSFPLPGVPDGGTNLPQPVNNRLPVVERLLAAGANLEAENQSGERVLHLAAQGQDTGMVRALLAAGATTDALDGRGFTALHHLCDAVTLSPESSCPPSERPLPSESEQAPVLEIGKFLIEAGVPLQATDRKHGATALHYAAGRGWQRLVEYLIAQGLSPAAKDGGGWTPRYWAIRHGWRALGKHLMTLETRNP